MITCKPFDTLYGMPVQQYTLTDEISVDIVTCGATVTAIRVPNNAGTTTDVLLAMTNAHDIVNTPSYMGSIVGRCANRIAGGKMTVEGKEYQLAKNAGGTDHLHGGNFGFNRKIFTAEVVGDSLFLSCDSADGEENYPANLHLTVKYTVKGSALIIEYFAESDGTTVFSPTNHAYFNLDGQDAGCIHNNVLQLNASKFLPISSKLIPLGEERPVAGTVFDFTTPKPIGQDIAANDEQLILAGGYDHNFCLDDSHFATAFSPKTGIVMDCFTDLCGVQLYTGNFLDGEVGKAVYNKRSGFCLETQLYPNSVNMPQWRSPILKKGDKFYSQTQYVFGVRK